MFRKAKKLVLAYRERILSLVLLPAFFLGTLPHTACICADGHREAFCRATTCRFLTAKASSECSCCQEGGGACEQRSCCSAKHGKPARSDGQPLSGLSAQTGSCCNPIVESPAPAVSSNKADTASKSTLTAVQPPAALCTADSFRPTLERVHHSTPPPLDLPIVYLHLTI